MAKEPWEKYLSLNKILFFRPNRVKQILDGQEQNNLENKCKKVLTQILKCDNMKHVAKSGGQALKKLKKNFKKIKKFLTKALNNDKLSKLRQANKTEPWQINSNATLKILKKISWF